MRRARTRGKVGRKGRARGAPCDPAALFVSYEYARLGAKVDLGKYTRDGLIDAKLFINVAGFPKVF